ncbi:MAG: hypothetical protein AAF567_24385 [Actinomycetota bacterium]
MHRRRHQWKPLDPTARWAWMRKFTIGAAGDPYIERFVLIRTPICSVMVHRLHRPDADRDLHNHPWSFASVVISGGYWESYASAGNLAERNRDPRRPQGDLAAHPSRFVRLTNRKRAWVDYHRITQVLPGTRTLVLAGPRQNSWGFWRETGYTEEHIGWREYLDSKAAA